MTQFSTYRQDQIGRRKHCQAIHHRPDAFRTAQALAWSTNKRYRLLDKHGQLLDLVEP